MIRTSNLKELSGKFDSGEDFMSLSLKLLQPDSSRPLYFPDNPYSLIIHTPLGLSRGSMCYEGVDSPLWVQESMVILSTMDLAAEVSVQK